MKLNFKIKILPLLLAVLSQTACVDRETKQLKANQDCQTSRDTKYSFGFNDFPNAKKLVLREMVNGDVVQEQTIPIDSTNRGSNGFGVYLSLMDTKNQNYYQVIVDNRYLFTLSEIDIYAILRYAKFSDYIFCEIESFNVNSKSRSVSDANDHRTLDKKDAIILPVANSKK